jgi:hypothetical protein
MNCCDNRTTGGNVLTRFLLVCPGYIIFFELLKAHMSAVSTLLFIYRIVFLQVEYLSLIQQIEESLKRL